MPAEGRRTIWLIAATCILPFVAAIAVYLGWPVTRHMNHGELMETRPLASMRLSDIDGKGYASDSLRGKWLLVTIQSPACGEDCRRKLYILRQVRSAQGENMERVARLWLLRGEGVPSSELLAQHPGLMVARPADPAWFSTFPARGDVAAHIYLIDPLGNFVLRYDEAMDPKGLIKDLARVLRVSRIG